jgi:hypothetical protein
MKRILSNTTGLSPVLKNPSPTKKGQKKTKEGAKQKQPWIFQAGKKMVTNNYKKHHWTSTIFNPPPPRSFFSGTPSIARSKWDTKRALSRPEGRHPKAAAPKSAATIDMVYVVGNRTITPWGRINGAS